MQKINGQTSVYGIIGNPVRHSLSPLFQNHFIQTSQKNAVYLPFSVAPDDLESALAGLYASGVMGLNVTVPHKEQALAWVQADTDAQTIGAVNTLKHSAQGWLASNTDWQGFAAVLQGLQADVQQKPVLLFGAGGTSRAICHALHQQGAQHILLCNRGAARVEKLREHITQAYPNMRCALVAWEENAVAEATRACDVIINSSSIGLDAADVFPFALQGGGVAIDAVYQTNGETAFVRAARQAGYLAVDGLPMLITQGMASFAFWHEQGQATPCTILPEKLLALQWVEQQLTRKPLHLPGWGK